ncbi:alpha/beta fold hydrolase [Embleya sp. NPDC001921]
MARVVIVHGVGKQYLGRWSLRDGLARAVLDGVAAAGGTTGLTVDDVDVAFYGDLFRPSGIRGSEERVEARHIVDPYETALLHIWWQAAAEAEPDRVESADPTGTRGRVPVTAQRAVNALLRSRFVSTATAERFLLGSMRQVARYFHDDDIRHRAQEAVLRRLGSDTTILVGHSLGSVVAYETLCAHPGRGVHTLITLGSPLGLPGLILDRLRPPPRRNGRGQWPAAVLNWHNINDRYDVVAAIKKLGPVFDTETNAVVDSTVSNGWKAHDLSAHLTSATTGRAILAGLMPLPR